MKRLQRAFVRMRCACARTVILIPSCSSCFLESHMVVNSSMEPRLKSPWLIDGEVTGIMDNEGLYQQHAGNHVVNHTKMKAGILGIQSKAIDLTFYMY